MNTRQPLQDVDHQAIKLLATVLGVDSNVIDLQDGVDTLKSWNSLAHMRLVLAIEEQTGRPLQVKEILGLKSIAGIRDLLVS